MTEVQGPQQELTNDILNDDEIGRGDVEEMKQTLEDIGVGYSGPANHNPFKEPSVDYEYPPEESELPTETAEKRLDLIEENEKEKQRLKDAHEQSYFFAHKKVKIDNDSLTLPEHLLMLQEKKKKSAPTKILNDSLYMIITTMYQTEEEREMIRTGMQVELDKISEELETLEMDKISDYPFRDKYSKYTKLIKSRDQALATIEYLEELESAIKERTDEVAETKAKLLDDYDNKQVVFVLGSGRREGTLRSILPQMVQELHYSVTAGGRYKRDEKDMKRVRENLVDSLQARFDAKELHLIARTLEENERTEEAEMLRQFI